MVMHLLILRKTAVHDWPRNSQLNILIYSLHLFCEKKKQTDLSWLIDYFIDWLCYWFWWLDTFMREL